VSVKQLVISDHALMRYMERVLGLDLEPYRDDIRGKISSACHAGASRVSTGGFTYQLRSGVLTTITEGASPQSSVMRASQFNGKSIRLQKDEA
jgi:hypothetical protein